MPTIEAASLIDALKVAAPGSTIAVTGDLPALPNGGLYRFGDKAWAQPVTLDLRKATISGSLYWGRIKGLKILGGVFSNANPLRIDGAADVSITGAQFKGPVGVQKTYGLRIVKGVNVQLVDLNFSDFQAGAVLADVFDFEIKNVGLDYMTADGLVLGGCKRGLVGKVVVQGTRSINPLAHMDGIQLYSRPDRITQDLVIEDCMVMGRCQGISGFNSIGADGIDPGGYDRITFRRNVVASAFANGITLTKGRDVTMEDNRVRSWPGARDQTRITVGTCTDVKWIGRNFAEAGAGRPAVVYSA